MEQPELFEGRPGAGGHVHAGNDERWRRRRGPEKLRRAGFHANKRWEPEGTQKRSGAAKMTVPPRRAVPLVSQRPTTAKSGKQDKPTSVSRRWVSWMHTMSAPCPRHSRSRTSPLKRCWRVEGPPEAGRPFALTLTRERCPPRSRLATPDVRGPETVVGERAHGGRGGRRAPGQGRAAG